MVDIGTRILSIIQSDKSPAIFCRKAGWTSGDISNIKKKSSSSVGYLKLSGILNAYPSVSAEWLMRGTGEMRLVAGEHQNSDTSADSSAEIIEALTLLVEQQKALVAAKDLTIQILLNRLNLDGFGNEIIE